MDDRICPVNMRIRVPLEPPGTSSIWMCAQYSMPEKSDLGPWS